MRAEQVSIAKRWRRPRSDAVQAAEKRSRTAARLDAADADFSMRVHRRARLYPAAPVDLVGCSAGNRAGVFQRELLKDHEQGLGTAIHVNAYKLSSLIPGALSLILADHLPWSAVFVITA